MFLALISSSFLSFQFVLSGTANVTVHVQVCGLFFVLFRMLCGFIQAKALNLGVLPTIVYPVLLCCRHCFFFLRCCLVFLTPFKVPLLLGGSQPCRSGNREVKHDFSGKSQTAKIKPLPSVFSSLYSRIKIFVFAVNSKRHFSIFVSFI